MKSLLKRNLLTKNKNSCLMMNMNLLRACIFCRQKHKTKFCDMIAKPEIRKETLFQERRCLFE